MLLEFEVNGVPRRLDVDPAARLIDVLRRDLGLTGTKEGCGEGECGACTVLVDDLAVDSCLLLAAQVRGRRVLTVEGLAARRGAGRAAAAVHRPRRRPVRFLHAGHAHGREGAAAAETRIRATRTSALALAGNLCRCTGYEAIVAAVRAASEAGEQAP